MGWWHWLLHVLGIDDASGRWYLWWSGAGGDLGLVGALLAAPVVTWRRHACQVTGCWRIGRHAFMDPEDKTLRSLCWRHHPNVQHKQLTRERLHTYLRKRPGRG